MLILVVILLIIIIIMMIIIMIIVIIIVIIITTIIITIIITIMITIMIAFMHVLPKSAAPSHHPILSQASLLKGGCPLRLSFAPLLFLSRRILY